MPIYVPTDKPFVPPPGGGNYTGPGGMAPATVAEGIFKPNANDYEVVGITGSTVYSWSFDKIVGIWSYGATYFTWVHPANAAEWTERADSARLAIRNDGAVSHYIYGVTVSGTPVMRLSGKSGFIHDDYVDYEGIARDGENLVEIGNNYVTTADQTNRIANWWWRNLRAKKHFYQIRELGFCSFYEVGEWYTLQITSTDAWNVEAVDCVAECIDVQCDLRAGDAGDTTITFREVYQNWVYETSAQVARYHAGFTLERPKAPFVTVASPDHTGDADYYCDGFNDQEEINRAISSLPAGGCVALTRGTFNISSSIMMVSNIKLSGNGMGTILRKDSVSSYWSIYYARSSTLNYVENINIDNIQMQATSNTTSGGGHIRIQAGKGVTINNVTVTSPTHTSIYLENMYTTFLTNIIISGNDEQILKPFYGIYINNNATSFSNIISGCVIKHVACTGIFAGIYVDDDYSNNAYTIVNNEVSYITSTNAVLDGNGGILARMSGGLISNNKVLNCKDASAVTHGVWVGPGLHVCVTNNYCFNNGLDTAIANTNTNNFHDDGTSTMINVNSWQ